MTLHTYLYVAAGSSGTVFDFELGSVMSGRSGHFLQSLTSLTP